MDRLNRMLQAAQGMGGGMGGGPGQVCLQEIGLARALQQSSMLGDSGVFGHAKIQLQESHADHPCCILGHDIS